MKIAICGPGGSGKDTIAEWFRDNTTLTYKHSTSYMMRDYVFKEIAIRSFSAREYIDSEDCYRDRGNHRGFWAMCIDEYNQHDAARLYKECAAIQDIITGIRKKREFLAAQQAGVFQLSIWAWRLTKQVDATQEYGPAYCDIEIRNEAGLTNIYEKLIRLSTALGIYVPGKTHAQPTEMLLTRTDKQGIQTPEAS